MRTATLLKYNAFLSRIHSLNNVPAGSSQFSVDPTVEQKLEDKIRENSDFLKEINIIGVRNQIGEKLGLDVAGPLASRTNTDVKERSGTQVGTGIDSTKYRCEKTDFDTFIKYATLDAWAKFPDFQKRVTDAVTRQIARDRMMIGFNGTHAAADTNKDENPLLQDVNIGWLKKLETEKESAVLNGIEIGNGGDFGNIDAAVYAARNELISEWHCQDTSLVCIMGQGLLVDNLLSRRHSTPSH